ncbi:hypothetical protein ACFWY6_09120, partial [Streptomyces sp. NPDC059037]
MAQEDDWQRNVLKDLGAGTTGPAVEPTAVLRNAESEVPADSRPAPQPTAPTVRGVHRDPRIPMPTPESVPTIDPRLARALGIPQHGDTAVRRTG